MKNIWLYVGLILLGSTIQLFVKLENNRIEKSHQAYLKCVESGVKPVLCSFNAAFKGEF